MGEYQYHALGDQDNYFRTRIFVLNRGNFGQTITGSLETLIFDDFNTLEPSSAGFEAVSYAWEGQTPSEEISTDGKVLKVTKTVAELLTHLRLPNQERRLWIDGMCINQDNDLEKASQVQSMQKIFRAATGVIVWLNLDTNTSQVAFNAASWFDDLKKQNTAPENGISTNTLLEAFRQTYPDTNWRAPFHVILNHPWFSRSWVLQEAILASGLKVQMCRHSIDWDVLTSATIAFMATVHVQKALAGNLESLSDICFSRSYAPPTFRGIATIGLIERLRNWYRDSHFQIPPSKLVMTCRDRHASLASDKIYSLAALFDLKCQIPPELRLVVDYRVDFKEVYMYFVKWCIEREGNLDIIAQGPYESNSKEKTPQLPTWAFDWQLRERLTHSIVKDEIPSNPLFAEYMANIGSSPLRVILEGKKLILRGFLIDTVEMALQEITEDRITALVDTWMKIIPQDPSSNMILLGHRQPTESHLTKIYLETKKNHLRFPPLWGDGYSKINRRGRGFLTERGCFGFSDGYVFRPGDKVCALRGGRALFILNPADSWKMGTYRPSPKVPTQGISTGAVPPPRSPRPALFKVLSGNCFINGFQNGQGVIMAQKLGLQEEDIHLV